MMRGIFDALLGITGHAGQGIQPDVTFATI